MFLPYFFFVLQFAHVFGSPSVAVIGGGISGATVAYRLRQQFQEKVDLDLYEGNEIGGRMVEVQLSNATYEIGAALFHANNLYMKKLLSTLGLEKKTLPISGQIEIWYKKGPQKYDSVKDIFQLYGYTAARASEVMGEVLEDEIKIYSCQAQGAAYRSLFELLDAMGKAAKSASSKSLLNLFRERGIGPAFIYRLGGLMTRVAYGQSVDIHALAGIISMVGMGSNPWAVTGGATQICREMINRSQATVHHQTVKSLSKTEDGKILLKTDKIYKKYDAVVLAAPYSSQLELRGFPDLTTTQYQKLVVTMVDGERCGDAGIVLVQKDDSNILSINVAHSIDRHNEDKHSVWRIHSKESLSDQELSELFVTWNNKIEKTWDMAYPTYPSTVPDVKFQLAPNLYYANAGEMVTSTAEFSVVAAYNVATLVYADLTKKPLNVCR